MLLSVAAAIMVVVNCCCCCCACVGIGGLADLPFFLFSRVRLAYFFFLWRYVWLEDCIIWLLAGKLAPPEEDSEESNEELIDVLYTRYIYDTTSTFSGSKQY